MAVGAWMRRRLLTGFFVSVPLVVSVAALLWIFGIIEGLTASIAQQALGRELVNLDALRTVAMVMAGGAQHLVVLRNLVDEKPLMKGFENG